jgi:hypothetical protein
MMAMKRENEDSIQSLCDEYFHKVKRAEDLSVLREALQKAQSAALRNLASAMKKTLPAAMVQEIIDRADPLEAFLLELRK